MGQGKVTAKYCSPANSYPPPPCPTRTDAPGKRAVRTNNWKVNGRSLEFNPLFARNYVGLWPFLQGAGPFFHGRYLA